MHHSDLSVSGTPDPQLVRPDWTPLDVPTIADVQAHAVANVLADNGYLTEMWRPEWKLDDVGVGQVFQRVLHPGAVSAWHVHLGTTDRLFCAVGQIKLVLFDARTASATHGALAEYRLGERRPAVISIPPGVYHGVQSIGTVPAVLINAVDVAYDYEQPDHHRVPRDSTEIPHRW